MPFYLIDKSEGISSNSLVGQVKNKTNSKKAGHAGTLDPFATGLLIIATDGETKFLDKWLKEKKGYKGTILFGKQTDTLDTEGTVTKEENVDISLDELKVIIGKKFLGSIEQTPPQFSAVKVDGKKAYEVARKGGSLNLNKVRRQIYSFEIKEISKNEFEFEVLVSSGTYISALARDLGIELNSPAMLTSLRRTSIGSINIKDAQKIEDELKPISIKDFIGIKNVDVSSATMKSILEGKKTSINVDREDELILVNDEASVWAKHVGNDKYKIHKRLK